MFIMCNYTSFISVKLQKYQRLPTEGRLSRTSLAFIFIQFICPHFVTKLSNHFILSINVIKSMTKTQHQLPF